MAAWLWAFALAAFAVVGGAADGVCADHSEGGQEQGSFESLVAAMTYPLGF